MSFFSVHLFFLLSTFISFSFFAFRTASPSWGTVFSHLFAESQERLNYGRVLKEKARATEMVGGKNGLGPLRWR